MLCLKDHSLHTWSENFFDSCNMASRYQSILSLVCVLNLVAFVTCSGSQNQCINYAVSSTPPRSCDQPKSNVGLSNTPSLDIDELSIRLTPDCQALLSGCFRFYGAKSIAKVYSLETP